MPKARRERVTFRQLSGVIYLAEIITRKMETYQRVMHDTRRKGSSVHEQQLYCVQYCNCGASGNSLTHAVGCRMSRDASRDASQM